jgi:hypothetical protein
MESFMSALASAAAIFSIVVAQNTQSINPSVGPSVVIPHGTKMHLQLAAAVNTADLQVGFPIVFNVVDPFPAGGGDFKGAQIVAFVTQIQHGSPRSRVGVGFVFDKIIYSNSGKQRLFAYIDGPNVKKITQPPPSAPQVPDPVPGPTNLAGNNPYSNSPLWSMNLNANPFGQAPGSGNPSTGGFVHSRVNATDVSVPTGTPVTIVLAHDLRAPAAP